MPPATYPTWIDDGSEIPDPLGYGQRAVDFLKVLRHPKSTARGRAFELTPWQERIVRRIYGPRHQDGTRVVKTVSMLLGRGGRKTALGAALSLLHFIGPERVPGGLVLNAASDREQARLAYDEAVSIIREDDRIESKLRIVDYRHIITHPKSGAVLRAISADAGRQHGLTPTFALIDELHIHQKRDLWDVVRTGLVKTKGSLGVVITTAGKGQQNIAFDMYEYACKVAKGEIEDESFLPILFMPDHDADWRSEETWRLANPGLDFGFPDIAGLRQLAKESERLPGARESFKQLNCNIWLDTSVAAFVDSEVYDRGDKHVDLEEMKQYPAWIGVDLSAVSDLSVIVCCWRLDDGSFAVKPWFFCPEVSIRQRSDKDRVPYVRWREEGHITATPGDVIDYSYIEDKIKWLCSEYDVREIAFDPYLAQQIMGNLGEEGLPVIAMRQGALTMGPAIRDLEMAIIGGRLIHGAHPLLKWNVDNVVVEVDKAGLKGFSKGKARERIDGAVAMAMAVSRATAGGDAGVSPYSEDRGFLFLDL